MKEKSLAFNLFYTEIGRSVVCGAGKIVRFEFGQEAFNGSSV